MRCYAERTYENEQMNRSVQKQGQNSFCKQVKNSWKSSSLWHFRHFPLPPLLPPFYPVYDGPHASLQSARHKNIQGPKHDRWSEGWRGREDTLASPPSPSVIIADDIRVASSDPNLGDFHIPTLPVYERGKERRKKWIFFFRSPLPTWKLRTERATKVGGRKSRYLQNMGNHCMLHDMWMLRNKHTLTHACIVPADRDSERRCRRVTPREDQDDFEGTFLFYSPHCPKKTLRFSDSGVVGSGTPAKHSHVPPIQFLSHCCLVSRFSFLRGKKRSHDDGFFLIPPAIY